MYLILMLRTCYKPKGNNQQRARRQVLCLIWQSETFSFANSFFAKLNSRKRTNEYSVATVPLSLLEMPGEIREVGWRGRDILVFQANQYALTQTTLNTRPGRPPLRPFGASTWKHAPNHQQHFLLHQVPTPKIAMAVDEMKVICPYFRSTGLPGSKRPRASIWKPYLSCQT